MLCSFPRTVKDWSRLIISASAGIACLVAPAAATTYQSSQPSWHAARGLPTSTLELRDDDGDGVSERTEYSSESTYDNRGNRVLLIERFYDDGIVDRVDRTSSTYGEASRLVHELEEWNLNANGSPHIVVERWLEYDGQGNLVEERFSRSSGDRLYTEMTLWQYDGAGRLIKEIFQRDDVPADGTADFVKTTTNDYNERGDLLETVLARDSQNDGVVDSRDRETWIYNERGDAVEHVGAYFIGDDGVASRVVQTTSIYDSRGNVLEELLNSYYPEGTLVATYVTEFTYNRTGQLIEEHTQQTHPDFYSRRVTYQYDSRKNMIEKEILVEFDDGSSGGLLEKLQYDPQGRLLETVRHLFINGSTPLHDIITIRREYDARSNLLQEVTETDNGADGALDRSETLIYEY